jgi:putative transposase
MDRPSRRRLYHSTPSWVDSSSARFFITICCIPRGREQLTLPDTASALFESVAFGQARGDWYFRLFLLMPDHCHAIASFADHDTSMSKRITDWKRLTARKLGVKWQRGFFDHRLRDDRALDEKANYIRMNPVRAGLCEAPKDWPYIWEA